MKWLFWKKKSVEQNEYVSVWKDNFTDCVTSDYLPEYSVCLSKDNRSCRFVAIYAGMTLCSNPEHKRFIPEDSEPFDPHKGQFNN